jgi:hypothetical protein
MMVFEVVFEEVEMYEAEEYFVGIFSSRRLAEEAGEHAIQALIARRLEEDGEEWSIDDFEVYIRQYELDHAYC